MGFERLVEATQRPRLVGLVVQKHYWQVVQIPKVYLSLVEKVDRTWKMKLYLPEVGQKGLMKEHLSLVGQNYQIWSYQLGLDWRVDRRLKVGQNQRNFGLHHQIWIDLLFAAAVQKLNFVDFLQKWTRLNFEAGFVPQIH